MVFSSNFAFFYDIYRMISYATKYPDQLMLKPLLDDFKVDGKMPGKCGIFFMGVPGVFFTKVKHVEELFTTKNANYSKHEVERSLGRPLLNNNVASMETDHPLYRMKRKALSAAFFKSKMSAIA